VKRWRLRRKQRRGLHDRTPEGFYETTHTVQRRNEDAVPLVQLNQGMRGTVAFAFGGRGIVQRLAEMGLTPGTEITVVREAPFHGPVEVSVRGISLALGHGVASRIFVKPLE